jgi:hypothetical protein
MKENPFYYTLNKIKPRNQNSKMHLQNQSNKKIQKIKNKKIE